MLRRLLFNDDPFALLVMRGLCFASPAIGDVAGGGDGGTSDGGGDSATVSEGDGVSTGDTDATSVDESPDTSTDSGTPDPNALTDSGDGRKIPQKFAELFKENKDLKEMYFASQALRRTFPGGVREAVQMAKDVEELGGLDAVRTIQNDLNTYRQDSELFEKGDPKWIESAFQESPDSALKHFGFSLDYVSDHHPEHYDHLMSKVIVNDIDANLPIGDIYEALAGLKDNPKAQALAKKLAAYYNHRSQSSKKVPEKQIDPERKKLDTEKQQIETEKQQLRNQKINTEAVPYLNRSIETAVEKKAKESGFNIAAVKKDTPKRFEKFVKDVRDSIHKSVLADSKFLDRYSAALASGDTAKCARMLNARHDQAIQGNGRDAGLVAGIFEEWFGPTKSKTAATASTARVQNTTKRVGKETPALVSALPAKSDIDYNDPVTDRWEGIYRLKTGQLIQVKR